MNEFVKKLGSIQIQKTRKKGKIPKENGKYSLPDRRMVIREDKKFILIGHRDKKRARQLSRCSQEQLRTLLSWPGFGEHLTQKTENMSREEMIRILNPKPRIVFHVSWLCTSRCNEAKQLHKLIQQAESI